MPKNNWKEDPLVSPGIVCYAGKKEISFWFSPLGQIVQFDTIKFRRTLKKYFVCVDWKSHLNSRVAHHEAPIKNSMKTT